MKKMKRRNTSRMGEKKQIEELDMQWQALHNDIVERCFDGTDNFEWSKISKLPLKVINILQPMTWRMRDAEEAARVLIDKDYIHPAAATYICFSDHSAAYLRKQVFVHPEKTKCDQYT